MLIALSPFVFTEVFADSFVVDFDKLQYNKGDSLTVSGEILDFGMPVIAMSIYDPDGKILSANNLEISPQNTFIKTILLDSPFYDKTGEYTIKLDYGQISENYFFIIESEYPEPEIFVEDFEEHEIILLYTDKKQYTDKDVIKITGLVSALDSPSVLMGIYDPYGMPTGFYFGSINPDLEFSASFLVKDEVNFRVDGTYSIKANYAETEAISFFEYYKVIPTIIEDAVEDTIKEDIKESNHVKEKIDESNDEVISDTTNIFSSAETINDKETNYNSVSETSIIDDSQKPEPKPDNNSIIQTVSEEISVEKTKNSENKKIKIINKKNNSKKIESNIEIKKQTNLTVEDVELGKLLNQINLECDSSTFSDTISYYDGMGPALYRLCKFDSSLNFFNESLIQNPNDVEILVNKGSALGKLGYFSEAIVYYDQAIDVDPDFLPAKNNKANALANLGYFDESISLYVEILGKNPNYITAKKNLETALSLTPNFYNVIDNTSQPIAENIVYQEFSSPEKISSINHEKQKPTNFFEEVSIAFSSLGSLFSFID